MPRSKAYKTEGVILRQVALGEADRIVSLYTRDLGKIRAVAKGIRRPLSKMGGQLEILSHVSLLVARGRNLDIVQQVQLLETFRCIRENLDNFTRSCYLLDLVDSFSPEEMPNRPLYHLLLDTLGLLQETDQPQLLLRMFELQLLALTGYQLELYYCTECRKPLEPENQTFGPANGGVVCQRCRSTTGGLIPLSLTALKVMRHLLVAPYIQLRKLSMERAVEIELEKLLAQYIRFILDREIRSADFLQKLTLWASKQQTPTMAVR